MDRPYLERPALADNHSHPVPEEALELLSRALRRQCPETVILERDNELDKGDEILSDVIRIRERIGRVRTSDEDAVSGG